MPRATYDQSLGGWTPLLRLQALVVAALIFAGVTAAGAAGGTPAPVRSAIRASAPRLTPAVPDAQAVRLPAPGARAARGGSGPATEALATPGTKWLPSGTGMWTHMWDKTEGGDARAVVRLAQAAGLSHIFVRTGTKKGGFDGAPILSRLLPATRGTDLKVIAWDFPFLANPKADAMRLAKAALYVPPGRGTPRVAAVAPDIETGSEGTRLTGHAVRIYYRELRRLLPKHIAILATVPWPSELRIGRYPYAESALYADAFIPMAYWMNRDPSTVARRSIAFLKKYGKPIMPAGQAYDPKIDRPDLTHLRTPSLKAVTHFIKASQEAGSPAVSLWVWQTADRNHWTAIGRARNLFRGKPAGLTTSTPKTPKVPKKPIKQPAVVSPSKPKSKTSPNAAD